MLRLASCSSEGFSLKLSGNQLWPAIGTCICNDELELSFFSSFSLMMSCVFLFISDVSLHGNPEAPIQLHVMLLQLLVMFAADKVIMVTKIVLKANL